MIKHFRFFLLFLALTAPVCFGQPASQPKEKTPKNVSGPREQLKQMVADLQKDPDNRELREKIIKLALTLKPKPVVPPEAKRPFMKAVTFQKEATSPADYKAAIKAYQEALILAPWWAEAYYNLAVAQESVGWFNDAMASFKLYLLTGPKDAEEAENRIYALEAKKEKAAQDASRAAEEERSKREALLVGLAGKWRDASECYNIYNVSVSDTRELLVELSGTFRGPPRYCSAMSLTPGTEEKFRLALSGLELTGTRGWLSFVGQCGWVRGKDTVSGAISPEGGRINLTRRGQNYDMMSCSWEASSTSESVLTQLR